MKLFFGVKLLVCGMFAVSACGGSAGGGDIDESSGSSTGGSSGGTGVEPGIGGASEGGAAGESGAAGSPPGGPVACPEEQPATDLDGPFELELSDPALTRQSWRGDDAPECTVVTAEVTDRDVNGEGSALLELECTADSAALDEPVSFEVAIAFGPVPGFAPRPVEPGSVVRFEYDYAVNINQPGQSFLLTATEQTPSFDAGELILGAVFSDYFPQSSRFGPLIVELEPALCVFEEWSDDCTRTTAHDLLVRFEGGSATASLGDTLRLDSSPPLGFRLTGNRTTETTSLGCCFDCDDDSISFGVWALE